MPGDFGLIAPRGQCYSRRMTATSSSAQSGPANGNGDNGPAASSRSLRHSDGSPFSEWLALSVARDWQRKPQHRRLRALVQGAGALLDIWCFEEPARGLQSTLAQVQGRTLAECLRRDRLAVGGDVRIALERFLVEKGLVADTPTDDPGQLGLFSGDRPGTDRS